MITTPFPLSLPFLAKTRWYESQRPQNKTPPSEIHCPLWERISLTSLKFFSDQDCPQTHMDQPRDWVEGCQGLTDENLVFGSINVCEIPSGVCMSH